MDLLERGVGPGVEAGGASRGKATGTSSSVTGSGTTSGWVIPPSVKPQRSSSLTRPAAASQTGFHNPLLAPGSLELLPVERQALQGTGGVRLRVMTYNVLADYLVRRDANLSSGNLGTSRAS